jgi:Ca2+:H+ antiporter
MTPFASVGGLIAAAAGAALIATVFAAVYHAEVVAHRTGELVRGTLTESPFTRT